MKTYTKRPPSLSAALLLGFLLPYSLVADEIATASGTVTVTVGDVSSDPSNPSYKVASVGTSGDPIFKGTVTSISGNVLTFESSTDSDGSTETPFRLNAFASSGVRVTATVNGSGEITGFTPLSSYTEGSGLDDASPPRVSIGEPETGDDYAEVNAVVAGGKVTGFEDTAGNAIPGSPATNTVGSGYSSSNPPTVTVEAGPHVIRVTEDGPGLGRSYLITANTANALTVSNPDGDDLTTIFKTDYNVEIVRASTLGEFFGVASPNIGSGYPNTADLIYLWSNTAYDPYFHFPGVGAFPAGWYNRSNIGSGLQNDAVIYPDEGFIIARRTGSALTLEFDGSVVSTDQQMKLPKAGKQSVMNNPFGADILLAELISLTDIGADDDEFKPATLADGSDGDNIYELAGGSTWKKYWYQSGINSAVTTEAIATTKKPVGTVMTAGDISLATGTVTALASCAQNGDAVDHNASEYTKVTLSTTTGTMPVAGFTITLSGVRGRKIDDEEAGEVEVGFDGAAAGAGNGINIRSTINGSFKVENSGTGYVIVKKRRNVILDGGSPTWSTGNPGAGYDMGGYFYCLGGHGAGGGTDANGTFSVSASKKVDGFTIDQAGTNYDSAPQIVLVGGGWRKENASTAPQDKTILGGGAGILIQRNHPTGEVTYLKARNPLN